MQTCGGIRDQFVHHFFVKNLEFVAIVQAGQAGGLLHQRDGQAQPVVHDVHQHQREFRRGLKGLLELFCVQHQYLAELAGHRGRRAWLLGNDCDLAENLTGFDDIERLPVAHQADFAFDQQVHLVARLAFDEKAFHFGNIFGLAEGFETFARDRRIVGFVLRGGLGEVEFHGSSNRD